MANLFARVCRGLARFSRKNAPRGVLVAKFIVIAGTFRFEVSIRGMWNKTIVRLFQEVAEPVNKFFFILLDFYSLVRLG